MKKFFTIMLVMLLTTALSTGAAWAKSGNAKKDKTKPKAQTVQMYKMQYKAMVDGKISAKGTKFRDTKNHWGSASIQRMADMELFKGYDDGTFKPNKNMSQAEMIALLMRLADNDSNDKKDTTYSENLREVPSWARDSVKKAINLKILNLNRFNSAQQASRAQTCVIFAKVLALTPVDIDKVNFKDKILISKDDLGYILAMYQAGYIKGAPGNYFLPNNYITRAEMATILERILKDLKEDEDDVDEEDNTDLTDLENELLDEYSEIEEVPVENIKLSGDEDRLDVEIEVELDEYKDEWSDLNNRDIKDYLTNLVDEIQDELDEDTIVRGKIINIDKDDVLVKFTKYGTGNLIVNYYDDNVNDINDVEDELKGNEYNVSNIDFKITSINYDENDEVTVVLKSREYISANEWDDLNNRAIEDDVRTMCKELAEAFQDDADAEPEIVHVKLYNIYSYFLASYDFDVENETLD
ncbi:Endo-1,4-beta-xylanase A precursor [Sporotomaculum syntrophicum]|uniref:Endo-1,4-beta-xylanase A n=1 Tax=Sporotomaculum syntrophicum TaxID=182264 RepID=A0A9D2WSC9_9FIRM|nr:S-layer homology domain-containing protein [Sporotomaculum syntrophicum]KAF1086208.1 Endo-1,4-beta-xylanase A precursor [Sporotomaculum syntrophicum]